MSLMKLDPKKRAPQITPKQLAILKALVKRNADGSYLDVQQLLEVVAPGTARGSMICSLRHMAMHDLIREDDLVTRRGRRVRTYAATDLGADLVRPSRLPAGGSGKVVTP